MRTEAGRDNHWRPAGPTAIAAVRGGSSLASSDRLLEAAYGELRRIAAARLRREHRDTLRPTELVHEAYMRLVGSGDERWNSLGHFFGAAAEAMRRVLIDRARERLAAKRGGGAAPRPLDTSIAASVDRAADQPALHEALSQLAQLDPDKAALVTLRYFAGLTETQAAEALGISRATAARHWAFARAWLFDHIRCGERSAENSGAS